MITIKEIGQASEYRRTRESKSTGFDVYRWPEFIAFAVRLGIPLDLQIKTVTIRIADDEVPTITLEMRAMEPKEGHEGDVPVTGILPRIS